MIICSHQNVDPIQEEEMVLIGQHANYFEVRKSSDGK